MLISYIYYFVITFAFFVNSDPWRENTSGNQENKKLCGNTTECLHKISSFPFCARVNTTYINTEKYSINFYNTAPDFS